ncbi:transporter substrate-binding domain-containing protein [Psychromonas sp. MME2]|uniref:transporter substrate-binding domain-containing protein n=1 Tax=Psychromonas sp. MME2 TaxID=3231033 RepID=UPI00339C82D7
MLNKRVYLTVLKIMGYCCLLLISQPTLAYDLKEVKEAGVLRHIGIPYANFVIQYTQGEITVHEGLDVELMQGFAECLGVKYQFVSASWNDVFGKLNGQNASYIDKKIVLGKRVAIQGDVISSGVTILPWRTQLVDFSDVYFPSEVWLVARADSDLKPIKPSGSISVDIEKVKLLLTGRQVLALKQSCLDADLYNLEETGANIVLPVKERKLNEMVPAILNNDAESTLLDLPDSLIALQKWPGEIKVIGPISEQQSMAVAFRKGSPELRKAFNRYFKMIQFDGSYNQLVEKYYPNVFYFYNDFFVTTEKDK